ncbi:MAG: 16S rRNA (adenine(1518)-N(6)/adenine(1519)-N(6))-dimethyltransferase RsmA [Holosporaceae bacterium]|jgi:16S rRNA (adenine1518-N6/adenine1519-N6)-dimethyltransferase|nr:16S rRNA (adenine(1518)-N(6)/adenine(1519)-N(6))-dimethyltransferase RsmA [Holosporaceae bacterium]
MMSDDTAELSAKDIFNRFPKNIERKYGQNFLFDERINRRIVSAAGDLRDKIVTEVGPGPGGLTLEILKLPIKKVYVLEFDPHWCSVWRDLSHLFDGKLEIIEANALEFNFRSISSNIIIANLPYNISVRLLFKWLHELDEYEKLILMFQKEVARRLCAVPTTKSYGKLSVLVQSLASVSSLFDVAAGNFYPSPKVTSTVVDIAPKPKYHPPAVSFLQLLDAAFGHRRKVVAKALTLISADASKYLQALGYGSNTRAEEISVDDYVRLHHSVMAHSEQGLL